MAGNISNGIEGLNSNFRVSSGLDGFSPEGEVSEKRVLAEMKQQGMATPIEGAGESAHSAAMGGGFMEMLKDSFEKVNRDQVQADQAIKEMISGRNKNIHETLLTIERADSSMKMMMQVRNKVLDAYREVMRMQV